MSVIEKFCGLARQGDVTGLLALFDEVLDPDVVLSGFSGSGLVRRGAGKTSRFLDIHAVEVERLASAPDCVVAFLHTRWRADAFAARVMEKPVDTPMAEVWRFRGGRIVEIRPFSFDEPVIPA